MIFIGLCLSYYFVILVPQKEETDRIALKEKDCTRAGIERAERDAKNDWIIIGNRYKYNEELDSCFYLIEYTTIHGVSSNHEIVDLNTNGVVYSYYTVIGGDVDEFMGQRMVEFSKATAELFYK